MWTSTTLKTCPDPSEVEFRVGLDPSVHVSDQSQVSRPLVWDHSVSTRDWSVCTPDPSPTTHRLRRSVARDLPVPSLVVFS